jgi:type II secretory pathway pseudopilin PulG
MRAAVRLSLFAILMIAARPSIAQTQQSLDQLRIEQQRAEAARRAAEEQRRQEEAARKAISDELRKLTPVDIAKRHSTRNPVWRRP